MTSRNVMLYGITLLLTLPLPGTDAGELKSSKPPAAIFGRDRGSDCDGAGASAYSCLCATRTPVRFLPHSLSLQVRRYLAAQAELEPGRTETISPLSVFTDHRTPREALRQRRGASGSEGP
jgi:hypothetical protein